MIPPKRIRRKPKKLNQFILSKKRVRRPKSLFGVREWRRSLANLISLQMECHRSKNFTVQAGLVPAQFISRTFFNAKTRRKLLYMNDRKFNVKEQVFRYKNNFPKLSPLTWFKKAYYNKYGEVTKHDLIWICFRYNPASKVLTISGKFKSQLLLSNVWRDH